MTIKELCKKHRFCDACPYLPICGDMPAEYESGDDLEVTNAIIETAKALEPQHIRIVDSAEVATTMAPVYVHNYLYWSRILSEIEKLGFSFCKIERSNDE